jgi:hypothetical protein
LLVGDFDERASPLPGVLDPARGEFMVTGDNEVSIDKKVNTIEDMYDDGGRCRRFAEGEAKW